MEDTTQLEVLNRLEKQNKLTISLNKFPWIPDVIDFSFIAEHLTKQAFSEAMYLGGSEYEKEYELIVPTKERVKIKIQGKPDYSFLDISKSRIDLVEREKCYNKYYNQYDMECFYEFYGKEGRVISFIRMPQDVAKRLVQLSVITLRNKEEKVPLLDEIFGRRVSR